MRQPRLAVSSSFFFFNDTATTEIYTLSLHDALPISRQRPRARSDRSRAAAAVPLGRDDERNRSRSPRDRKSTRLNSSHLVISYAVFCLKKKKLPHRPRQREKEITLPQIDAARRRGVA